MIRINLLPTEKPRESRKPTGLQPEQKVTLACSLILVVTALGLGWGWFTLDQASARLSGEVLAKQREVTRLRTILTQVDTFDKQKQQLQQRVALIEELRRGQSAPVHILDELSRALPDMLWLTEMKQDDSGALTVEGRCANLTSLSDFIGNLERSGYFVKPVEIIDSQVVTAPNVADLIKFSVKATYALPTSKTPSAQKGPPPPRAR
jgi:type IV pilus assembly protein PilN